MSDWWIFAYLVLILIMSIISFFFYRLDKRKAEKGRWRISESILLGLGVLGGALGALVGMKVFRHKTKHWYFWAINLVSLLLHIAIPIVVYILLF